jgi:septum formation protein
VAEPKLVLASSSPRRASILETLRIPFRIVAPDVDETLLEGEGAAAAAARLARAKAEAVASRERLPVLAADTLVACDELILGKPASAEDAARMLRLLSGRSHEVITGVCLIASGRAYSVVERTAVVFGRLSDADVAWYVGTGEPFNRAGAYHVDGQGALFVQAVEGSPSNVSGLPVRRVLELVRQAGLDLGLPTS